MPKLSGFTIVKNAVKLVFPVEASIRSLLTVCDEVVVLYAGAKVDSGSRKALAAPPFHPYADLLISSVPELRTGWLDNLPARVVGAQAVVPANAHEKGLCRFLDRCPVRIEGVCDKVAPPRRELAGHKEILCHHTSAELQALQS